MPRAPIIAALITISSWSCTVEDDGPTLGGDRIQRGGDSSVIIEAIDHPGLPSVLLTSSELEFSLGIYQANTGKPYVTLRDADGDGVFDILTYSSLSKSGDILVDVEDYGMDGQPDFILNHREAKASVYYQGAWHDVSGIGTDRPAIVNVDGTSLLLEDILDEVGRNAF